MTTLLLHTGDHYVVQGVEHDIAAQGRTPEEARHNFEMTVLGQCVLDLRNGLWPLENIPPAPVTIQMQVTAHGLDEFRAAARNTLGHQK